MAEKSVIQVGMLGFGNVGQGLYRLLEKNRTLIEGKIGAQLKIKKILVRDPAKPREVPLPEGLLTSNFDEILNDPEIDVVLEL
ncbi:MAG TPA: homoserine dehydrogenase, partial [bacterium]|nr:homoserine dehydrogenase [bacterium]